LKRLVAAEETNEALDYLGAGSAVTGLKAGRRPVSATSLD
jgi:hypothetical protein